MLKIYQILALLSVVLITSCGGGSGNDSVTLAGDNPLRIAVNSTYTEPGLITDGTGAYTTDSTAVDTTTPGTYTVVYTYIASNKVPTELKRTVIVGNGNSDDIATSGTDPLYKHQWHLNNTGQKNSAINSGIAGEDINIHEVVTKDGALNGEGVLIAILDSGLELEHQDLKNNIVLGGSREFVEGSDNPTSNTTAGDHGTSVAGIIAAEGWNGVGGRGVAPKAKLVGFNLLNNQSIANFISALGGAEFSEKVDIFNQSYGSSSKYVTHVYGEKEAQYKFGALGKPNQNPPLPALRNGKGAIYVKAAGNGFEKVTKFEGGKEVNISECVDSKLHKLSCQNTNMDPENTLPYNIVIGALNAKGKKSSYSTAGSSLWVSAPGGEYGINDPAILTVDQSGCNKGYSKTSASNCNYTSTFNGTSSATPIVSGAIAIILQANPNLSWREVKYILAETSDQVDPTIEDTVIKVGNEDYIAEPKWLTNKAIRNGKGGYKFHNYYGFGRINVGKAVKLAKDYAASHPNTPFLTKWIEKNWESHAVNQSIPNNNKNGLEDKITINGVNNLAIEAVRINLNIEHPYAGELSIELTSPSGTKSILLNAYNGFERTSCPIVDEKEIPDPSDPPVDPDKDKDCYKYRDLRYFKLLSNAFYGETSAGEWTIKIVDAVEIENTTERYKDTNNLKRTRHTGRLLNWSIKIFGH